MVLLSPWVSNKASIRSIASSIVVGGRGIDSSHNTMGSQVVSTGSHNGRLISRGDSTVSIGNQSGDMEGSSISISSSIGSRSSSNSRLINRGDSSIRVGNQGGDVKGTSISVSSSIGSRSSSNHRGSCSISSSIAISGSIAISCSITSSIDSILGGQMVSTGSCNCRLINRGDCSIGMGLQSIKSRGSCGCNASSKNQKLHIVLSVCVLELNSARWS